MPYMIHQQVITAVRQAYDADPAAAAEQLSQARRCHQWLESLAIDPRLRHGLVEPIAAVEEALADALAASGPERA